MPPGEAPNGHVQYGRGTNSELVAGSGCLRAWDRATDFFLACAEKSWNLEFTDSLVRRCREL